MRMEMNDQSRQPLLGGTDKGCDDDHHPIMSQEESPAYQVLRDSGLLETRYRKRGVEDLDMIPPNTDKARNLRTRMSWYMTGVGFCTYDVCHLEFTVPAQHVQKLLDHASNYIFAGPGMHNISSMFWKRVGYSEPLKGHIQHGDQTILVVNQGFIGYAMDNGMPVLLPPGIHQWRSHTLSFLHFIDLEDHVIEIGPYTLLTVDEGYSAVTQDNGKQVILEGGKAHFLDHRNWKFEKFMSQKVQTDDLDQIEATSADNILMSVTSTLNWRIVNVQVAAVMAAETMAASGITDDANADISKLRGDVLKQAIASLAAFIGSVNYSDSFHLAAAAQASHRNATTVGVPADGSLGSVDNPMFDVDRMHSAVEMANKVTMMYGVEIISINIISANPVDDNLQRALASGAVASAEALQAETAAQGNSKASLIEAKAAAEARKIQAKAEAEASLIDARAAADSSMIVAEGAAEAERTRAKGAKDAADLLSTSEVAVDLAKMEKSGALLGDKSKLILGTDPSFMKNLILPAQALQQ